MQWNCSENHLIAKKCHSHFAPWEIFGEGEESRRHSISFHSGETMTGGKISPGSKEPPWFYLIRQTLLSWQGFFLASEERRHRRSWSFSQKAETR